MNGVGVKPANRPPRRRWIKAIGFALLLLIPLVGFLESTCHQAVDTANRNGCANNLKTIGNALLLYANENSGSFPDTLEQLAATSDLPPACYVCPGSNDTIADIGATAQTTAANIVAGGHASYVYLGKGFKNDLTANAILAYEFPGHHRKAGMNVLFGDFHVEWVNQLQSNHILKELQMQHNPPGI